MVMMTVSDKLNLQEEKPALVHHRCIVYNFKCDLCDADNTGYTHGVAIPDVTEMFSFLKKCTGKVDCLVHEMLLIREQKPKFNTQSYSIRAKVFM